MSDTAIQPVGIIDYNKTPTKIIPVSLVILKEKTNKHFIAVKQDYFNDYMKVVGFFHDLSINEIVSNYEEIIKTTDKSNYIEISIPLSNISYSRSLVYRHK